MINSQKLKLEEWNLPYSKKFWGILTFTVLLIFIISQLAPPSHFFQPAKNAGCIKKIAEILQYSCSEAEEKGADSPFLTVQTGELNSLSGYFAIEGSPRFTNNSEHRSRVFLQLEVNLFRINSSDQIIETLELQDQRKVYHPCQNISQGFCENEILTMFRSIRSGNYYLIAKIVNFDQVENLDYRFRLIVGNSDYIEFGVIYRIILIACSIAVFVNYYKKIKLVNNADLLDEQRYLKWIGYVLIFYLDPFFYLASVKGEPWSTVGSCIATTVFLSVVLFFWIFMFEKIAKGGMTNKLKGAIRSYATAYFIASTMSYYSLTVNTYENPLTNWDNDNDVMFVYSKKTLAILNFLVLIWLFGCIYLSFVRKRYSDPRNLSFTLITIGFLFGFFVLIMNGGFHVLSMYSRERTVSLGIMALYIDVLFIIYTPSSEMQEIEMFQFQTVANQSDIPAVLPQFD